MPNIRALGVAHGGLSDTINICYLQAADAGEHLCDIIGVIMHEFGHANGFPKDKFHQSIPYSHPNVFKTDIIYRIGNTAVITARLPRETGHSIMKS